MVKWIFAGDWIRNGNLLQDSGHPQRRFYSRIVASSFQYLLFHFTQEVRTTWRKDTQWRHRNTDRSSLRHSAGTISRREGLSRRQRSLLATVFRLTFYFRYVYVRVNVTDFLFCIFIFLRIIIIIIFVHFPSFPSLPYYFIDHVPSFFLFICLFLLLSPVSHSSCFLSFPFSLLSIPSLLLPFPFWMAGVGVCMLAFLATSYHCLGVIVIILFSDS